MPHLAEWYSSERGFSSGTLEQHSTICIIILDCIFVLKWETNNIAFLIRYYKYNLVNTSSDLVSIIL